MSDRIKEVTFSLKGKIVNMPFNKFEPEKMVTNPAIMMIAKRGSGKSWICMAIMSAIHDIPVGVVISPTERLDPFYTKYKFIPPSCIFDEFNDKIIENLRTRYELIEEKNKKRRLMGKKEIDNRSFIIMDDCLSSKGTWMKNPIIKDLLQNGRHYGITYIFTSQSPLGLTPELRNNFDYVFLLADNFHNNIKKLYDHYAGMFPHFTLFKQAFSKLTENYSALVITNRSKSQKINEIICWYKAPNYKNPNIRPNSVGSKQLWEYHENNYNKEWQKKQLNKKVKERPVNMFN